MRYSTKVKIRKNILIALAIIAFVALNIWVYSLIVRGRTPIERSAVLIAQSSQDDVFLYDEGAIVISGVELNCLDINGEVLFNYTLPEENMKAYRNGKMTICWHKTLVVFLNDYGKQLVQKRLPGDDIVIAVCNDEQFAAAVLEEGQTWIRVYNENGILIEENIQPFLSALSLGYFGEKDSQLWALLLDYHGTLPITKLYTRYPGKSQTGRITINNQVCYDLVPLDDYIYVVGTRHIQSRTYTNTKLSEWLINGWAMQDYYANSKDEVSFVMAPVDTTENNVPLSAVWYINPSSGEQYRISMPADIMRAVITEKKIYAVSKEGIYNMDKNGQKRGFIKLPFDVDKVVDVSQSKLIAVLSGEEYYMIKLK